MPSVQVVLLSGESTWVTVECTEQIYRLRRQAQEQLKVGLERLLNSTGEPLDELSTVASSKVQEGDTLTALGRRGKLCCGAESLASR
eukprot:g29210.t1